MGTGQRCKATEYFVETLLQLEPGPSAASLPCGVSSGLSSHARQASPKGWHAGPSPEGCAMGNFSGEAHSKPRRILGSLEDQKASGHLPLMPGAAAGGCDAGMSLLQPTCEAGLLPSLPQAQNFWGATDCPGDKVTALKYGEG